MSGKGNTHKTPGSVAAKKTGGGKATAGGVNYQATVTAIVAAHILRGTPLGWLEGVVKDRPHALWAESEGPGDDIRIELENNQIIEIQVKKGLKCGPKLWASLEAMASAIHRGELHFGVLAVAPDSSEPIRLKLAADVKKLGQGRTDKLSAIGQQWLNRLRALNIAPDQACHRLRIHIVHGLDAQNADIKLAKKLLLDVCSNEQDVQKAWSVLFQHAANLMQHGGRWDLRELMRLLASQDILIAQGDFPAATMGRLTRWVVSTNAHFAIAGTRRRIPLEHLLAMKVKAIAFEAEDVTDALAALARYHTTEQYTFDLKHFDSTWIARFRKLAVVVAGPGLGKSTMMVELAHQYALDGYIVLSASLKAIATTMQQGATLSDALMGIALDGSGVTPTELLKTAPSNWIILLDALDECGKAQEDVARQLARFAAGHPQVRMVVTTRPIGYDTVELEGWVHYRLLPPASDRGASNLARLLRAVDPMASAQTDYEQIARKELERTSAQKAIVASPLLLGMAASLIQRDQVLPTTHPQLYSHLIDLFNALPKSKPEREIDTASFVLHMTGWELIREPLLTFEQLIQTCADTLSPLIDKPRLATRQQVREALAHWEQVGLIEPINHASDTLLTFTHKTFAEFSAACFLVECPQHLTVDLLEGSAWRETIVFATWLGLADKLIALRRSLHQNGASTQLQAALALLGRGGITVSRSCAQDLVQYAFDVMEKGDKERCSIAVALSDLAIRDASLVAPQAAARLTAEDPQLRLMAWGMIVHCTAPDYDASALTAVFWGLLPHRNAIPAPQRILQKDDLSDLALLERIAMAALKAQPLEHLQHFAEVELEGTGLMTVGFRLQMVEYLQAQGLDVKNPWLVEEDKATPHVTLTPLGPGWRDASRIATYLIAEAISNGIPPCDSRPRQGFPNYAGLLRVSGFDKCPVSDLFNWMSRPDLTTVASLMQAIARIAPLDATALAHEAKAFMACLDANPEDTPFELLPSVDVPPPDWESLEKRLVDRSNIKRALFHDSNWVVSLAAQVLLYIPMDEGELTELLEQATGISLDCTIALLHQHAPSQATSMMIKRLEKAPYGNVSGLFESLTGADLGQDSPTLLRLATQCLTSSHEASALAAAGLLQQWIEAGNTLEVAPLARARAHWQAVDMKQSAFIPSEIAFVLGELCEKASVVAGT